MDEMIWMVSAQAKSRYIERYVQSISPTVPVCYEHRHMMLCDIISVAGRGEVDNECAHCEERRCGVECSANILGRNT